ncbi:MAG: 4-hydroxy-2-oxovalerate aldolase [Candidatus Micrarchaeota archaeon]
MKKVNILETTLRDGSYAVNYSFTALDTATISRQLELAGFEYIEIGHGVGFNGSTKGYGKAVATDEEYLIAAKGALKNSKFGMFCIPGIAEVENIDMAHKHGMSFVRVGTNVTEIPKSEDFIKRAKDCGMFVAANYMKSYALPPRKFAENVLLSEKYGADMVYLVDSAGGMFTENVLEYYNAIRSVSDIPVGFHGHDNLGLAIANSIAIAEAGASFVDSSLQGLGRSSGNATTEILVAALMKKGYALGIDFIKTLELGQKYINPILPFKGKMPLDIVSGYADFHSSYMHKIEKYSVKYSINPCILIIELCKVDRVNASDEVLEKIAQRIKKDEEFYLAKYDFGKYVGGEQDELK